MSPKTLARILFVDDERSMRDMTSILLKRHGYDVMTAQSGQEAAALLDSGEEFDLIVTDLLMDQGGGIDVLDAVKKRKLGCEVIVITAFGTPESAVEAMKKGAFDYISKPFNVDEFLIIVRHALERKALIEENINLRAKIRGEYRFVDLIGRSRAMGEVIALCRKVKDSPTTLLLSGESGTGKEVVARAIHFAGLRADAPFVAVNCGALPEQLMESELFGHDKGSFTGATENKQGLFRAALGGTVFLDEIGELPMPLQVKMLRVLQEKTVRPVGAAIEVQVEARVIAATNQNLEKLVKGNLFRKDLFYRLNVIRIGLPRLCERKEDIPVLVEHFLQRIAKEHGAPPKRVTKAVMRALTDYDYPGNVRELINLLERAVTFADSDEIDVGDLPAALNKSAPSERLVSIDLPEDGFDLDSALKGLEQAYIEQAMDRSGGVQIQAAALLGITARSFRYRLAKLGFASGEDGEK
jgi:two-component system response regulator PilR (NtrC family)